jgi:hypothetical protein
MAVSTRLQLFKDVASELGDLISLEATATGTTSTFVSTNDMLYPDGSLNGREAWYASAATGSNRQTRRLVTDTDQDTGTITVSPVWPSIPAEDDVVLLVNSRGTGVTIPDIHNKINQLIRRVGDELATVVSDAATTFDMTSPVLSIPTSWDYLLGVQIAPRSDQPTVWQNLIGKPYSISAFDSTVTILPTHLGLCNGKSLRLIGAIALPELTDDTDTTTAPASWLAKRAAAELSREACLRSGDVATALTLSEILKTEAMQLESYVSKRFAAFGHRIDLRR